MKIKTNNLIKLLVIVSCLPMLTAFILGWHDRYFVVKTVCFFLDGNLQKIEATNIVEKATVCRFTSVAKTVSAKPDTVWTPELIPDLKQTPLKRGALYGYVKQGTIKIPERSYSIPTTTLYWIEKGK